MRCARWITASNGLRLRFWQLRCAAAAGEPEGWPPKTTAGPCRTGDGWICTGGEPADPVRRASASFALALLQNQLRCDPRSGGQHARQPHARSRRHHDGGHGRALRCSNPLMADSIAGCTGARRKDAFAALPVDVRKASLLRHTPVRWQRVQPDRLSGLESPGRSCTPASGYRLRFLHAAAPPRPHPHPAAGSRTVQDELPDPRSGRQAPSSTGVRRLARRPSACVPRKSGEAFSS